MGKILTDLSFADWVRHLFDHPVTDPVWHWNSNADSAELERRQVVAYATELFERSEGLLASYTDAQANQGLWFLICEGISPLYALADTDVPLAERVRCLQAIPSLFKQCFVPRCTPHLSNRDEPGAGPLNSVCYMWWDIFPLFGQPEDATRREIDTACLSAMATILELPSIACQESALHGLGHWGVHYPGRCQSIIAQFMERHHDLRAELCEYATRAYEANVL